jgi:TRAP-type C4-dicarboxylate transport system substrate-binding protein
MKRAGGSPITMSFPELAPALDRSAIDAVTTTASGAAYSLRDLLKYEYRIPIAYSQVYEIISKTALEKLSPASQDILRQTFQERLAVLSQSIADDDVTLTRKMRDGGMQIADPTPEEAAASEQMMLPYWETWAKERGPVMVEALAKVRSELGR